MSPTAAARTSKPSASSLRDRLKDPSLLRDRCYIDGAWIGTPANPVTNPVNGVELAKVPKMSTAEASQAVEAAERAFPAWAKLTAKQRSNILRKWFDLIIANREDLALILTSEQGKPLSEALGEIDISGAYVEFFAEEARRVYGGSIWDDLNNLTLLGQACLGFYHEDIGNQPQPQFWEAGLMLAGVGVICLMYLNHRTRGVEIVS